VTVGVTQNRRRKVVTLARSRHTVNYWGKTAQPPAFQTPRQAWGELLGCGMQQLWRRLHPFLHHPRCSTDLRAWMVACHLQCLVPNAPSYTVYYYNFVWEFTAFGVTSRQYGRCYVGPKLCKFFFVTHHDVGAHNEMLQLAMYNLMSEWFGQNHKLKRRPKHEIRVKWLRGALL
jgi:hypothetical protein